MDLGVAVGERFAKKNQFEHASKILRRAGAGLGLAGVVFDVFDLANAENTEQRIAAALGIAAGIAVVASGGAPLLLFAEGSLLILDATGLDEAIIRRGIDVFDRPRPIPSGPGQ